MFLKYVLTTLILFASTNIYSMENMRNSIVKIHVGTFHTENIEEPWRNGKTSYFAGTGVVIEGNKILTSASLISNATYLSINKENSNEFYKARLKHFSKEIDLALLEVEDETFFNSLSPIKLLEEMTIEEYKIFVLGYEAGDNQIKVRDAAIKSIAPIKRKNLNIKHSIFHVNKDLGDIISGGLVLNLKQEVVGIGMQARNYFSTFSYVVPIVLINRFLKEQNTFKKEYFFGRDQFKTIILGE